MTASDKIIKSVQPHLAPGETVVGAFAGQPRLAEIPGNVRFGQPHGMLWHEIEIAGEHLYVNRRYFGQLRAIDAAR